MEVENDNSNVQVHASSERKIADDCVDSQGNVSEQEEVRAQGTNEDAQCSSSEAMQECDIDIPLTNDTVDAESESHINTNMNTSTEQSESSHLEETIQHTHETDEHQDKNTDVSISESTATVVSYRQDPPNLKIKVVLVGESGVGKSCIFYKILGLKADGCAPTIGVDLRSKDVVLEDQTVTLQLYDTAGQTRFRSISRAYYRGADSVILVYDITNLESFTNAKEWATEVTASSKSKCTILLGNKSDLQEQRVVSRAQGQQLADKFGFVFMETSIMDSANIDLAVKTLTTVVKSKITPPPEPQIIKRDYVSIKVSTYSPVLSPRSATMSPDASKYKGCLLPIFSWCGL